jgi:hypothetical protein
MVAHIKSHRLVAFLIYSSLSIYASHGKNEYITLFKSEPIEKREKEINLTRPLPMLGQLLLLV